MNSITIAGTLGRDAEVRYLANGDAVASFSVADSHGREKATIWWNCSLFGKRAESLAQYLVKGQAVTVSGSVTEREYQKDGVTKKAQDVRVNDIALQGGKREESARPSHDAAKARQLKEPFTPSSADFANDSDIPF
jgi:single-strand DNA-binding protein